MAGRQNQRRLLQEGKGRLTAKKTNAWRWTGRRWNTIRARSRNSPRSKWRKISKTPARACARCSAWKAARPQKADKAGAFLWAALSDLWTYSANRVPEISNSVVEIDRAMRLGFNWELGPFELWDAAGVEATVARMKKEGKPVAANVERLLASGQKSWYIDDPKSPSGRKYWELGTESWEAVQVPAGVWSVDGREEIQRRGQEKFRSLARRSGRRRGLHRVSQQDELAGRRHHQPDHSIPKTGRPRRCLRRLRHHQRRHEFFRRRQPHAAADERAGRRVGRRRPRHPPVPGDDAGHQVLAQASRSGAVRAVPGRRHRNFAARRGAPAPRRTLYRTGRSRRRPAPRRRRLQRDAAARRGQRGRLARQSFRRSARRLRRNDGGHEEEPSRPSPPRRLPRRRTKPAAWDSSPTPTASP